MAMGAGSKQPRPLAIRWYTANRRSLAPIAWCLAALVILVIFYLVVRGPEIHRPTVRELEEVEEETFPVRSWRNPPAVRRKGEHRTLPVVDEFLVESSAVHRAFFPKGKVAVDPVNGGNDDRYFYYPGRVWLDTDGRPIQAYGGGVMYDEKSETYFWYGENKDGKTYKVYNKGPDRVDIVGVSCYSSKCWIFCDLLAKQ